MKIKVLSWNVDGLDGREQDNKINWSDNNL